MMTKMTTMMKTTMTTVRNKKKTIFKAKLSQSDDVYDDIFDFDDEFIADEPGETIFNLFDSIIVFLDLSDVELTFGQAITH